MMGRCVYSVLAAIFIVFAIVDFVTQGDQGLAYSAYALACLAMART